MEKKVTDCKLKYKVYGCSGCRSLRVSRKKRPLCLYCGEPMTNLYASFLTVKEAKEYIEELKKAEME